MCNPGYKSLLIDSFGFDLFANKLWLPAVIELGGDTEHSIFQHILSASKIWTLRFEDSSSKESPVVVLAEENLYTIHDSWLSAIEKFEYNDTVEYINVRGVHSSALFGDIARHVVNHGTYHRGQLRQIISDKDFDFPETDFMIYASGRSLHS